MLNFFWRLTVLAGLSCAITYAQPKFAVTTHHYDTFRTGWNSHETVLNPAFQNRRPPLASDPFNHLVTVPLDDTVYAQPLVVPDVMVGGTFAGKHDVVYVVTENNTIYAIDANTGAILLTRYLGPGVDRPGACENNGPHVGIESTPVIDAARGVMYLIAYMKFDRPTYRIHAIDLSTLSDRVAPVVVSATHTLFRDGKAAGTAVFDATVQRQRPALLLADGNVYAAFGSFCDNRNDERESRGWILGWQANTPDGRITLNPLPANIVTDSIASSNKHLSSIWMSGAGLAAVAGHIYFTTGNSPDAYDSSHNLAESVVKVSSDLTQVLDFLTPRGDPHDPSNCPANQPICGDWDLSSGGVLIVPDQAGQKQPMAVAAGKDGRMFLINRSDLGKNDMHKVLGTYPIGGCFCTSSYYLGNIVSSGGSVVHDHRGPQPTDRSVGVLGLWQINTASSSPTLTAVGSTMFDNGGPDPGFFTSVSSNGASNVIIWAVSRETVNLYAFQPVPNPTQPGKFQLKQLNQWPAGNWNLPDFNNKSGPDQANSNIVPVVANGHVYVASYKQLQIFGFQQRVNK